MKWSEAAATVWGKSDKDDPARWLPLVQHLGDAMEVAGLLWDRWLPAAIKTQIDGALPEGRRDGRVLVRWLAGVHDVGKASPVFASQVEHLAARMERLGARIDRTISHGDRGLARHAAVGQVALEAWMKERFGARGSQAATFASVVGAHHGRTPRTNDLRLIRERPQWLGEGLWHDVRVEILDEMAERSGAGTHLEAWSRHRLSAAAQMVTTGVVIVADWLASDSAHFPLTTEITDGTERAQRAWEANPLPPAWTAEDTPDVETLMADRFPSLASYPPRPIQRVAHELARSTDGPALLALEAPMGQGKTEAGLVAAEVLAARFGQGGVFLGLPTMATSDAMFSRVVDWIDRTPGDGAASTFLAHSKAAHNELWQEMLDGDLTGVYDEDEADGYAIATAIAWLNGRKKGMLANFVVGTIDQALFMALCAKHVMLRHLALAGKVVVLDEVHAADDYMRVYLKRALRWLSTYGVPVVLLSATLPSTIRRELVEAYADPREEGVSIDNAPDSYPMVTVVDGQGVSYHPVEGSAETATVSVQVVPDDLGSLDAHLAERLSDGGCVAIIRDTVARAQETYQALREEYGEDVVLFHSRFLAPHRASREAWLRDLLGRDSAQRPQRLIVVGTQVLEQSLDVDFDLMISDVAPVDLLLQRMGRLHRHRRAERPKGLGAPELLLTGITRWGDDGPEFAPGLTAVYPEALHLRALTSLGLVHSGVAGRVELPRDIRPLVESSYASVSEASRPWPRRAEAADRAWEKSVAEAVVRAQGFLVPDPPRWEKSLVDLLQSWGEKNEEDRRGSPQVRDGEDSLEVIVVRRQDGELRTMPGDHPADDVVLPLIGPPEWSVARRMAAMTVRLPAGMCHPGVIEQTIASLESQGSVDWQTSGWLSGRLVLTLDEEWSAEVTSFRVEYSDELGLRYAKGDADD